MPKEPKTNAVICALLEVRRFRVDPGHRLLVEGFAAGEAAEILYQLAVSPPLGGAASLLPGPHYCHTLGACVSSGTQRRLALTSAHGVSFEEAETAFDDRLGAYYPDALHENRLILIGYSQRKKLLFVVHAEVGEDAIRIISARKATRHEKGRYEND